MKDSLRASLFVACTKTRETWKYKVNIIYKQSHRGPLTSCAAVTFLFILTTNFTTSLNDVLALCTSSSRKNCEGHINCIFTDISLQNLTRSNKDEVEQNYKHTYFMIKCHTS